MKNTLGKILDTILLFFLAIFAIPCLKIFKGESLRLSLEGARETFLQIWKK